MATRVSSQEVAEAITSHLEAPANSLPSAVSQLCDDFVKQSKAEVEQAVGHGDEAFNLAEQLSAIWEQHAQWQSSQLVFFTTIVTRLLPSLTSGQAFHWCISLLGPCLEKTPDQRNQTATPWKAYIGLLDVTATPQSDGGHEDYEQVLVSTLERWLNLGTAQQDLPDTSRESRLRQALQALANGQPKPFFSIFDGYFVRKKHRRQCLTLLSDLIPGQLSNAHLILETPLFQHLLTCLQKDTSNTTITLALTVVTMILPCAATALPPLLPILFNIYARLLFWTSETHLSAWTMSEETTSDTDTEWEADEKPTSEDTKSISNLQRYFTILYGLYPLNFMDYIRKPKRYLRHANSPDTTSTDSQASELQQRSERFRRLHQLHPNFYKLTVDTEKTDFSRWAKSSVSDIVSHASALCYQSSQPGSISDDWFQHTAHLSSHRDHALSRPSTNGDGAALLDRSMSDLSLSNGSHQSQLLSRVNENGFGHQDQTGGQHSVRSMSLQTHRSMNAGSGPISPRTSQPTSPIASQLPGHTNVMSPGDFEVHSRELPHSNSTRASGPGEETDSQDNHNSAIVSRLQGEIVLLTNEVKFEKYMKEQHMHHIGELRRRRLDDSATEADTQNLLISNRTLKQRLEESKRTELQVKKESENRRQLSKRWEADLANKLKVMRDEQKKSAVDSEAIQRSLDSKTDEFNKLVKVVCQHETKELNVLQNMQMAETQMAQVNEFMDEMSRLKEAERQVLQRDQEVARKMTEAEAATIKVQEMEMKMASQDQERLKVKAYYEAQIHELRTTVEELQSEAQSKPNVNGDASQMMRDTLAASRAKQGDMQKQYDQLMRKYNLVQTSLLDLSASTPPVRTARKDFHHDVQVSAIMRGTPPVARDSPTRFRRGMSDPEVVEGVAYNVTPPLEALIATSSSATMRRPSTPTTFGSHEAMRGVDIGPAKGGGSGHRADRADRGEGGGSSHNGSHSSQGRSGMMRAAAAHSGAARALRKEKKKDGSDKKDKKGLGIRGMGRYI